MKILLVESALEDLRDNPADNLKRGEIRRFLWYNQYIPTIKGLNQERIASSSMAMPYRWVDIDGNGQITDFQVKNL